jgi:hypothetical protein
MTHDEHISSLVTATIAASRAVTAARKHGTPEELEAARFDYQIAQAAAQRALKANIARLKSQPVDPTDQADSYVRAIHACRP